MAAIEMGKFMRYGGILSPRALTVCVDEQLISYCDKGKQWLSVFFIASYIVKIHLA